MYKKIVGIFICTLFLFSALPTVTGTNHINKIQESLLTIKNANAPINPFSFELIYGRVKYNGEDYIDDALYHNITPIFLRYRAIAWNPDVGFYYTYIIITEDPLFIPKDDSYFTGFVGKNYIFLWNIWIDET